MYDMYDLYSNIIDTIYIYIYTFHQIPIIKINDEKNNGKGLLSFN